MQENAFRNRITKLSFALTILVIWVHSVNVGPEELSAAAGSGEASGFLETAFLIERFLAETIGQIAVPGFFMISAFLFYRGIGRRLSFEMLSEKWKRRFFSLLLPYVLWNLLAFFIYFFAGKLFPQALSGRYSGMTLSLQELLDAALHYRYNPVFWYLWQLILLTALAPFVHTLLRGRRTGGAVLAVSFLCAVCWSRLPLHLVNEDALFYYMLGAYAALHPAGMRDVCGTPFRSFCEVRLFPLLFTLLTGLLLFAAGFFTEAERTLLRTVLFRAAGPVFLYLLLCALDAYRLRRSAAAVREADSRKLCAAADSAQKEKALPGFMKINFFVYATHYYVIRLVRGVVSAVLLPVLPAADPAAGRLLLFLLMPILCIGAAWVGAVLLKKALPGLWCVLNGGR